MVQPLMMVTTIHHHLVQQVVLALVVVGTSPWSTTGTGVFLAQDLGTVDRTDPFNPVAGVDGPLNNYDPNAATDGGIPASDVVGGVVYTVCLEDIASSLIEGERTTTNTSFTSTMNGFDFSEICFGTILLSAELSGFTIEMNECNAGLQWTTLSESNLEQFDIQKSTDGQDFRTIGSVKAAGYSTEAINYSFQDTWVDALNYYRLKMVDFDGSFTYSDIRVVQPECRKDASLGLSPNPVMDAFTLEWQAPIAGPAKVIVFDALGKPVQTNDRILTRGYNSFEITTESLSVGAYLVQIIAEDKKSEVKKFMKIR